MKSRKLELVPLEDRSVPAVLATHAAPSPPLPEPAVIAVASAAQGLALASTATPSQGPYLGKLAANHNQTLVRDRRGRKTHRR